MRPHVGPPAGYAESLSGEIQTLKAAYHATYGRDLSSVIRSELSAKTERLFNMALVGNREEGDYIDPARVEADSTHGMSTGGRWHFFMEVGAYVGA